MSKGVLELLPDDSAEDDASYLTSLLHIMVSLKQASEGRPIALPDEFVREVISADRTGFCKKLRAYLSAFGLTITDGELAYLRVHLPGRYGGGGYREAGETGVPFDRLAEEVLYEVEKRFGTDLKADSRFVAALSRYLKLTFYRAKLGIQIKNSMLGAVRDRYGELFDVVEKACRLIFSKYNVLFPEDEIGFLVLYIGARLEQTARRGRRVSILILCPNGVFASRILLRKIRSVFQDVGPVEVGSLRDLPEKGRGYDLILSTVEVGRQDPQEENLLVVSPFLSDGDIVRIGERIRGIRGRPGRAETGPPAAESGAEKEALVRGMAEGLWLKTVPAGSFEAVVGSIAAALCDGGVARDRGEIGRLILKREKMGSIVIPHSHVSLLHIRSDLVSRPFVGVFRMDGSVLMESAGFVQEPVDTFLVLLARENESPAVLEKMGNISVALIEDAKFPSMLRQSRLDGLRALLKDLLGLRR